MFYTWYHIIGSLLCALAMMVMVQSAHTQPLNRATQRLVLEVVPATRFTVSGDPGPLIIYVTPGLQSHREVRDASSSYSMMTNGEHLKIVVSIDRVMPRGMWLSIELESEHGMSCGQVDISRALQPVVAVSGIDHSTERNGRITYVLTADQSVDFNLLDSRIITLTLTE